MVMKIGAPSIAVRIDTGISAALMVRARVSTIITKHAPQLMHAGSSLAWLFPNKSLHTCGTNSPTQPTCPHIATHEAVIAAQQTGADVTIVDSENVTAGERVLVDLAIRLRDEGLCAKDIAKALEQAKSRLCILGRVDTLEYLYRGGRLSKTGALAGTLLGIRPVLTVQDGALCVLGKARGARQSNNFLNEAIAKRGGIDFTMPLMLGYSGSSDEALREYIAASREIWEGELDTLPVTSIGSTIGTHVGPGAIVVAFFAKET